MFAGLMILNYRPPEERKQQLVFKKSSARHWWPTGHTEDELDTHVFRMLSITHVGYHSLNRYGVILSCVMVRKYNMSNTIISGHHWFSTLLSKKGGVLNGEKRQICTATNSATGELFLTGLKQETKRKNRGKMWLSPVKPSRVRELPYRVFVLDRVIEEICGLVLFYFHICLQREQFDDFW